MTRRAEPRLRVFLAGTEFFRSHGGIQYINRLLVRAFQELGRTTPLSLDAFSYTDGPEHLPADAGASPAVRWHAAGRSRPVMAAQFARRLALARPDLVLFTHVALLPLARAVRAIAPGARVTALAHGTEVWRPLSKRVARELPQVASVVCPSAFTARKLVEVQGVPKRGIAILPHGLDPAWMQQCDMDLRTARPREGRTLLTVTRLTRADTSGKGVELVLRSLPLLAAALPDVRYVVIGGGEDLPRLAETARQAGVENRVEFRGPLADGPLRRAYAEADVFVLPTKVEGFGVVFIEAMYNRLPVVAVRASATTEVVEDGITGCLVPPDQPAQLAAALVSLFRDAELRREMGEAGRRRVEGLYQFNHFTARWERWLATQAPAALYAARQGRASLLARAVAGPA
jgi:glycosyltransferase involved in cell wall biosynthesis